MKIPLTTYVDVELDAAVERVTRRAGVSRSKWFRRLVFDALKAEGELDEQTVVALAIGGNAKPQPR